jgi:hypothetical protein
LVEHRLVQLGDAADVRGGASQHDSIRIEKVVDCGGLAKELRVRNDVEGKIAVSLQGILQNGARPVAEPTGTVDLLTMTASARRYGAKEWMALSSWVRSGDPSGLGGVPTQRKMKSASDTALAGSPVNCSRPVDSVAFSISGSPGSWNGA